VVRLADHVRNRGIRGDPRGPGTSGTGAAAGDSGALDVVLEGLRRLEYRGYDSAGVALQPDGLVTAKRSGKLGPPRGGARGRPAAAVRHGHRAHPVGHARCAPTTSTRTPTSAGTAAWR
jgi:glucosamine--fructose-6-phosphate aminotransferase (isomerizing)